MAELKTTRTAIVVGGASGIGWATAKALAADGCRVVIADRNAVGANDRAAELGTPHTAAYVDVTDEDSVQRLFDDAGPVDVVVSCAGFSNVGLITDMPVDQFRAVVDVCLTGAFIVAKHAGQRLGEGGVLVSISSLNGRQPAAGISAYCAAKAGLSMLTQVAALELGQPVSFTGKQAVVTGAGSGIGRALCRALAAAGADVLCTDVYGDAAERMALGLGARSARLDVTAAAAVETTVDDVVARAGRLDLSPASGRCPQFNNAGIAWGGDTELLTLEQWNAIIDINIRGVVHGVAKPRLGHAQWMFARLAPGLMQRASVRFVARQREMQASAGALPR